MKKLLNLWYLILLVGLILGIGSFAALAATPNPSSASSGYEVWPIPIMGTYSSTSITPVTFKAPFPYRVLSASVTARAAAGTNPTLTLDVKSGSTSMFSAPIAVTAGTITDAVLGTSTILADEGTVSIILATGGTAPKWRDITLLLAVKRR